MGNGYESIEGMLSLHQRNTQRSIRHIEAEASWK